MFGAIPMYITPEVKVWAQDSKTRNNVISIWQIIDKVSLIKSYISGH